MTHRRFAQVDVFAVRRFSGNPVAVVLDAEGLDTESMQRVAHWTNLSETAFVLAPRNPAADYRVRFFTPGFELPFAGHPTLGTCHAWLEGGGSPHREDVIVQECGAGLVRVRRADDGLAFAGPPLVRSGPVEPDVLADVTASIGVAPDDVVDAAWVDNGPGWVGLLLADAAAVLAVRPGRVDHLVGVVGPHPRGGHAAFEVRGFFPKDGATVEDPVTGSLNASLAEWLIATGRARAPYVARQGTAIGRAGDVHVTQDADGTVRVGGTTVTCISGRVEL